MQLTSLYAIPFETGLIYFPPLCWASTLIKRTSTERNQALKAFTDDISNLFRIQTINELKTNGEEINLFIKNQVSAYTCMYMFVCVCVFGGGFYSILRYKIWQLLKVYH